MADRILVWHIPTPGDSLPVFYMDKSYDPTALRIYAKNKPNGSDLTIDILDDGVSIMDAGEIQTTTFKNEAPSIEYHGRSSTAFSKTETINGTTSSASAKVVKDNGIGTLNLEDVSGTFTKAETITGASSGATATVDVFMPKVARYMVSTETEEARALLQRNSSSDAYAHNFKAGAKLAEGSWVSLSILDSGGANGITVQLELDALSESNEKSNWAK